MRHYNYDQGGFHIYDSTHLLFTNVTVYSCPGMAFIVKGDSHHLEWNGVRILPRPGEPRPITCTADHFHVSNSLGWLKFEGCDFGYGGDDCINIHDNNFYAVPAGPDLLEGRFFRVWATPVSEGDPLELRREDLSPAGFTAKVKSIHVNAQAQTARIRLDRPLPAGLGDMVVCYNRRFGSHHYIIRHCRFGRNRAAGFRLQADDGLARLLPGAHREQRVRQLRRGRRDDLIGGRRDGSKQRVPRREAAPRDRPQPLRGGGLVRFERGRARQRMAQEPAGAAPGSAVGSRDLPAAPMLGEPA